jgi:hypothetical protein
MSSLTPEIQWVMEHQDTHENSRFYLTLVGLSTKSIGFFVNISLTLSGGANPGFADLETIIYVPSSIGTIPVLLQDAIITGQSRLLALLPSTTP